MSIALLIFDVDGTLADTEEAHRQAFNRAFVDLGLPWVWSPDDYRELLAVTGGRERIATHIHRLGLPHRATERLLGQVAALHARKTEHYTAMVRDGAVALRPGVHDLLASAHAEGWRTAIATTTTPANVAALLDATLEPTLRNAFEVTVAGDSQARKKPAPDAYLEVLARTGVAAAESIAFEDSANGLRAARAAGIPTVVTPTVWTAGEDFSGAWCLRDSLGAYADRSALTLTDLRFMQGRSAAQNGPIPGPAMGGERHAVRQNDVGGVPDR